MKITRRLFSTSVAVGSFAALNGRAQTRGPLIVTGAWPLGDFARELQNHYAKPVTFETPVLLWQGHMAAYGRLPDGIEMKTWVTHSFTVPDVETVLGAPTLTSDLISRVIEAYHQSNPGFPRYRVSQSPMGFHIIPTHARDEAGVLRSVTSVLDTAGTVLTEKRTASEHIRELLAAVSVASGVSTLLEDSLDSYYGANGYLTHGEPTSVERPYILFEWGVRELTAREALIDLLGKSVTTLSWTLASIPDYRHQNRAQCRIGFMPLTVNGRTIWFDRCTACRAIPGQR